MPPKVSYDLDLNEMAKHRTKIGAASLEELRPFISNSTIPIAIRRYALVSVRLPQVLYGAELWGMSKGRSGPAQRVADKAMRLLISMSGKGASLSLNAMRVEMGLDKVEAMAAARRARAVIKFASLKTWIAKLVKNPLSTRKTTWVSGTTRWLSRFTGIRSLVDARQLDPSASNSATSPKSLDGKRVEKGQDGDDALAYNPRNAEC